MNYNDAVSILGQSFFSIPGSQWRKKIDEICRKHPRRNGSAWRTIGLDAKNHYEAAFRIKQEISKTRRQRVRHPTPNPITPTPSGDDPIIPIIPIIPSTIQKIHIVKGRVGVKGRVVVRG